MRAVGVIDALGAPKSDWHGLAQVLRPVATLITDEGLDSLDVHLVNETAVAIDARLELACLHEGATKVVSASKDVTLAARSTARIRAADLLGQFFDFTYAYRSGPRAHDATVIALRDKVSGAVLSEAFNFPERACTRRHEFGLEVCVEQTSEESWALVVSAKRLARCVHVVDPYYRATLDWFHLSPGRERRIPLVGRQRNTSDPPEGEVRARNATFSVHYPRN